MSVSPPEISTRRIPDDGAGSERLKPINFAICLGDAFTFPFGTAFFSLTTIVPLFLRQLHASNVIIGLLPAMLSFGYLLPGLFVARRISRLTVAKWWLFIVAIFERLPLLSVALLIPVLGPDRPDAVVLLFMGGFALHGLCLGLNQPAYWSVVGKVIPMRQRGRMFGWAGVVGGLAGFSIYPITRALLTPAGMASLRGFSTCFLIGVIVLIIGIIPFAWIDEPRAKPQNDEPDRHAGHFRTDARLFLKSDKAFRQMLVGQCCISLAALAQPFFVIDYGVRFHVSSSAIANFTTIGVVLGAFGSIGWGAWGDHRGNKGVLILSAVLSMAAASVALLAPAAAAFYAVFAFSALSSTGIGIGSYNIVMEFAGGSRNIPFHTSLFNAITAPFRVCAPILGGVLSDHFGYGCIFALSAVLSALGLLFTARMVEPRKSAQAPC